MPYTSVARDVMTQNVITMKESDTVADLVRIICENKISGIPVVDDRGWLAGIVSKTDLIAFELEKQFDRVCQVDLKLLFRSMGEADPTVNIEQPVDSVPGTITVGSIMKRGVITAGPDTPLVEIADLMRKNRIHRVVITEGGVIAGIVTSMDLLRLIVEKNPRSRD